MLEQINYPSNELWDMRRKILPIKYTLTKTSRNSKKRLIYWINRYSFCVYYLYITCILRVRISTNLDDLIGIRKPPTTKGWGFLKVVEINVWRIVVHDGLS